MNDMIAQPSSRITYQGPPHLVGTLAEMLRDDAGCRVEYTPPQETRDAVGTAALVVATVQLMVQTTGTDDRVKDVVNTFMRRFSRARPSVTFEDQPSAHDAGSSSLADELAKLASLHTEGHLSDEEFTDAKARIIHRDS
ncbi:SHOCT domain-containing protein [Streptomyces sp. NPDC056460]|uniref:SHOCT domain-containing protein n=1 Tax=Streptomyces sp. NPDC056460 TaxID=3345825 RepID=UPI0036CE155A